VYSDTPIERVLIGERPWRSRVVLTNFASGHLFPEGFLAIFFADLYGFDADRYSLLDKGRENLVNTDCLAFSVAPISERDSWRFLGEIWVDSSSYGIVRLKRTFTGPYDQHWYRGLTHYYHFDSWREKAASGRLVPRISIKGGHFVSMETWTSIPGAMLFSGSNRGSQNLYTIPKSRKLSKNFWERWVPASDRLAG
jgi:hypothetical protein